MPTNPVVANPTFAQCVVEFEDQYYSEKDLDQFFGEMGLPSAPVKLVGPNHENNPGGEANLDIQWIMALAPGVPTWFWSIAAPNGEEIDHILTWAYDIGNTTNPPLINSLSYGMDAKNVDKYLGQGYLARSDVEFQKLSLMGITLIFADGDTGAGDLGGPPMGSVSCKMTLNPTWPNQSPYVTSVGSTYITPLADPVCYQGFVNCLTGFPNGEVGVSMDGGLFWTTGGGFADFPARPSYQDDAVTHFLNTSNALPPSSFFNAAGRGYPDVSAVGHNLMTVISGILTPVDGTSASAPIFAGIVSQLTNVRLQAGKKPLGFLNPLLYKIASEHPEAFYDVTVGYNRCGVYVSATPSDSCCPYGYAAQRGWDPMTGLGTPNFKVLSELVLQY